MSCEKEKIITVTGVSKRYEIYARPALRLWQMLFMGHRRFYREFLALRNVSFSVNRGECLGIIGRNGAGKSTLLQILVSTLRPSSGEVTVRGRIAALLELGSGFDPEFTGRENVWTNAAILGLTPRQIEERYQSIVDFADIGTAIDQPVKTYSSGMAMRLAFAVIAHVDADILIIDEALAVGDYFFAQKCYRFLREFMKDHTVILVTHDVATVCDLCDRVIFLADGEICGIGEPREIVDEYLARCYAGQQGESALPNREREPGNQETADVRRELWREKPELVPEYHFFEFDENAPSFGHGGALIREVCFAGGDGQPLREVRGGEEIHLRILCEVREALHSPIIGFAVRNVRGENLFGDNTYDYYRERPLPAVPGEMLEAEFVFDMPRLLPGEYSLHVAIADGTQDEHVQQQWFHNAVTIVSTFHGKLGCQVAIPMRRINLLKHMTERETTENL